MVCGVVVAAGGACPAPVFDITVGMAGPLHGVATVPMVPVWNGHGRSPAQCGNGAMVVLTIVDGKFVVPWLSSK